MVSNSNIADDDPQSRIRAMLDRMDDPVHQQALKQVDDAIDQCEKANARHKKWNEIGDGGTSTGLDLKETRMREAEIERNESDLRYRVMRGDFLPPVVTESESSGVKHATPNWKMRIQTEATALCLRLRKSGANPTKNSILDPMAKWCRDNNVMTDSKIFPSANYLRTHVLGGKHWDVPN